MEKNVVYTLTQEDTFLKALQEGIGGVFVNEHTLYFPEEHPIMSGTLYRYNVHEGVKLFICSNIQVKSPFQVERVADYDNAFLVTHIYLSDTPLLQNVGNETKAIMRLDGGVFHNSSSVSYLHSLTINQSFSFLAIVYSRQWIKELLNPQQEELMYQIIHSNKAFAFYESLSREWQALAEHICSANVTNALDKLELHTKALAFALKILRKLSERKNKAPIIPINRHDLTVFLGIRQTLIENFDNPPIIARLAKQAAMSESKLKTGFKQIFGDSIYQYALKHKLEMGYELLSNGEKTVKEVSYELGYTNPSQFTKKFKEHFDCLPTHLIKEAK